MADGRVFALGPRGHLFALDASDGSLIWTTHLADDLGSEAPFYGFTSSPLVAGDVVVVQIGAGEGKSSRRLRPPTTARCSGAPPTTRSSTTRRSSPRSAAGARWWRPATPT